MDFEVYLDEKTGQYFFYRAGAPEPEDRGLTYIGTAKVIYQASTEQYIKAMEMGPQS